VSRLAGAASLTRPALRWAARLAQVALGLALIWWLFRSGVVDGAELAARMRQADGGLLLAAALCLLLTNLVIAARYRLLLPAEVGLGYCFSLTLLQQALVTFVPWRLGEASYPLLLRRDYGLSLAQGAAGLLAVRLTDLLLTLGVGLAAAARLGLELRWIVLAAAGGAVVTGLAAIALRFLLPGVSAQLWALARTTMAPLRGARRAGGFLSLSVASFCLGVLQSSLVLAAFGFAIHPLDAAALQALSLLFALLPIHPPGGWGTTDAFQLMLLAQMGYEAAGVAASVLAAHSYYTLLILIGGAGGWVLHSRRGRAAESATARWPK
jgi:uncharacterized membrane protein YbhN (UPF0104 family)